jgi:hypothetical protein
MIKNTRPTIKICRYWRSICNIIYDIRERDDNDSSKGVPRNISRVVTLSAQNTTKSNRHPKPSKRIFGPNISTTTKMEQWSEGGKILK